MQAARAKVISQASVGDVLFLWGVLAFLVCCAFLSLKLYPEIAGDRRRFIKTGLVVILGFFLMIAMALTIKVL